MYRTMQYLVYECGVLLALPSIAFIWMLIKGLYSNAGERIALTVLGLFFMLLLMAVCRLWRQMFSFTRIDGTGVTNSCITKEPIHLAWNECKYIGMGYLYTRSGRRQCIYFSKIPIEDKAKRKMNAVDFSEKHLWVQYRPKVLDDVLQYIDKQKIDGIELVKMK